MRQARESRNRTRWRARQLLRFAEIVCFVLSFLLLGYLLVVFVNAEDYQRRADIQMSAYLRMRMNTPRVISRELAEGHVLGRMRIRRLKMSVPIVEGASARILRLGAGHVPGTAIPGSAGNVSIVGHRDTFFHPLQRIREGDEIEIDTASSSSVYKVAWIAIVSARDGDILELTEAPSLTLVTCYPFHFIGAAPERFAVRAHRVSMDLRTVGPDGAN